MPGLSLSVLTFELLFEFLFAFLFKKFAGFFRAAGLRFDDEGFAGGGGGGSLVTVSMIRADYRSTQWKLFCRRAHLNPLWRWSHQLM
jgi:hypothetical protein